MELQPAEMSSKKAALGCVALSLLRYKPCTLPEPSGTAPSVWHHCWCLQEVLETAWAGGAGRHGREGMDLTKEAGKVPWHVGSGHATSPLGWGSLEAMGTVGKPHGNCCNITPGWTKATPSNSSAWCCAHLKLPDIAQFSVHAGQSPATAAIAMSQAEAAHVSEAIPWPSCHPTPAHGIAASIAWASLRAAKPVTGESPLLLPHAHWLAK